MAGGCREPAGSHSFHLVDIKHQCCHRNGNISLQYQVPKTRVTSISKIPVSFHFLIHFHNDLAKQEGPSCFLLLCVSQTGNRTWRKWEWGSEQAPACISCCDMLFHVYTLLSLQSRQADLSTQRCQKKDIPVSGHWVVFSKTTQDTIILLRGRFEIAFTF